MKGCGGILFLIFLIGLASALVPDSTGRKSDKRSSTSWSINPKGKAVSNSKPLYTNKITHGIGHLDRSSVRELEDLLGLRFERSITNDGKDKLLATDKTEGRIVELIDGRKITSATAITTIPYPTSSVPAMQQVMFIGYFAAIVAPESSEEIMSWWGKSIDSGVNRRRTFGSIVAECDSIKVADGMIATLTLKIR